MHIRTRTHARERARERDTYAERVAAAGQGRWSRLTRCSVARYGCGIVMEVLQCKARPRARLRTAVLRFSAVVGVPGEAHASWTLDVSRWYRIQRRRACVRAGGCGIRGFARRGTAVSYSILITEERASRNTGRISTPLRRLSLLKTYFSVGVAACGCACNKRQWSDLSRPEKLWS